MTTSHTTKTGKAKCLAYRKGKRCGRVAKFVGEYRDSQGSHHQSLCPQCVVDKSAHVVQESPKGFTVSVSQFGPVDRAYRAIQ